MTDFGVRERMSPGGLRGLQIRRGALEVSLVGSTPMRSRHFWVYIACFLYVKTGLKIAPPSVFQASPKPLMGCIGALDRLLLWSTISSYQGRDEIEKALANKFDAS